MNGPPRHPAGNRRLSPRAALRGAATVVLGDQSLAAESCNISCEGIGLLTTRPISPGRRCEVTFVLPAGGAQRTFTATVKVLHSTYLARERFQIGAAFLDLPAEATAAIEDLHHFLGHQRARG